MIRSLFVATALAVAISPASAQELVKGDAVAGLVSKTAKAEVHLLADPALNNRRLVLKIVVVNQSGVPQAFGPDAVHVTAGDAPIALASREVLLAEMTGRAMGGGETSQAHANATLPVNATGQPDVTGFTGSMATGVGGTPTSAINRSRRGADAQVAAKLDAVLLKQMTIRPNGADGGQVLTEQLKRSKTPEVTVAIAFAGETHFFAVKVPR